MRWFKENPLDKIFPTVTLETDRGWEKSWTSQLLPTQDGDGWQWRVPVLSPDINCLSPQGAMKNEIAPIYRDYLSALLTANEAKVERPDNTEPLSDISVSMDPRRYKDHENRDMLKYFVGRVTLQEVGFQMDNARAAAWEQAPYDLSAMKTMLEATRYRTNMVNIISELASTPCMSLCIDYPLVPGSDVGIRFIDTFGANAPGIINENALAHHEFTITDANNVFHYKDDYAGYCCGGGLLPAGEGFAYWQNGYVSKWLYIADIDDDPPVDWRRTATGLDSTCLTLAAGNAINELKARGIPPFRIPDELGGGEKYLLICDSSLVDAHAMLAQRKDVFLVPVSTDILLAGSLPRVRTSAGNQVNFPVFPMTSMSFFYAVGFPGVFRFVSQKNRDTGILEWAREFGGDMKGYAWNEMITYKSARSPQGSISRVINNAAPVGQELYRLNSLAYEFYNAQDVIKGMGPLGLDLVIV